MSKDVQRESYEGVTEVGSDPFHLLERNNRNHRKKQNIILDHTAADRRDTILEVGCGDGLHAPGYAEHFEYVGVDLSHSLVEQTRSRLNTTGRVFQMDATNLSFADDAFSAVVGTAILHHLEDQEQALREWQRVVEPGGSVTLMEPNPCFPKDFITAYAVPKERHKTGMFPWRLSNTVDAVAEKEWRVEPHIYTPPWPAGAAGMYDTIDDTVATIPGLRWTSQMLLIHIQV